MQKGTFSLIESSIVYILGANENISSGKRIRDVISPIYSVRDENRKLGKSVQNETPGLFTAF